MIIISIFPQQSRWEHMQLAPNSNENRLMQSIKESQCSIDLLNKLRNQISLHNMFHLSRERTPPYQSRMMGAVSTLGYIPKMFMDVEKRKAIHVLGNENYFRNNYEGQRRLKYNVPQLRLDEKIPEIYKKKKKGSDYINKNSARWQSCEVLLKLENSLENQKMKEKMKILLEAQKEKQKQKEKEKDMGKDRKKDQKTEEAEEKTKMKQKIKKIKQKMEQKVEINIKKNLVTNSGSEHLLRKNPNPNYQRMMRSYVSPIISQHQQIRKKSQKIMTQKLVPAIKNNTIRTITKESIESTQGIEYQICEKLIIHREKGIKLRDSAFRHSSHLCGEEKVVEATNFKKVGNSAEKRYHDILSSWGDGTDDPKSQQLDQLSHYISIPH